MQKDHAFFDDLAKMASGAASGFMDMKREVETMVGEQVKQMMSRMDVVTRDEFEAVKKLAENARAEADALKTRLDALEKAPTKKPATKNPSTKKS